MNRTSALTDVGNGWWEVELFGPVVEMADGSMRSAHCYRRHVQSIELATAMIQWWHTDYPVAA